AYVTLSGSAVRTCCAPTISLSAAARDLSRPPVALVTWRARSRGGCRRARYPVPVGALPPGARRRLPRDPARSRAGGAGRWCSESLAAPVSPARRARATPPPGTTGAGDRSAARPPRPPARRSEEHTSELQSLAYLVC